MWEIDTTIALTEGGEQASPSADRSRHLSQGPLMQSGSPDISPVQNIEAKQDVSSASILHPEKQVLDNIIVGVPEMAFAEEEVRTHFQGKWWLSRRYSHASR